MKTTNIGRLWRLWNGIEIPKLESLRGKTMAPSSKSTMAKSRSQTRCPRSSNDMPRSNAIQNAWWTEQCWDFSVLVAMSRWTHTRSSRDRQRWLLETLQLNRSGPHAMQDLVGTHRHRASNTRTNLLTSVTRVDLLKPASTQESTKGN